MEKKSGNPHHITVSDVNQDSLQPSEDRRLKRDLEELMKPLDVAHERLKQIRVCSCGFRSRHPRYASWRCLVCKQKSKNSNRGFNIDENRRLRTAMAFSKAKV